MLISETSKATTFDLYESNEADLGLADDDQEPASEQIVDPEDMSPHKLRMAKPNGIGLGFGMVLPLECVSLHGLHTLDDQSSIGMSLGTGTSKSKELETEQNAFVNKAQSLVLDASYYYWPRPAFPFVLSVGGTLTRLNGTTIMNAGEKGNYKLLSVAAGVGLGMHTIFENGIWINWQILTTRYGTVLESSFSGLDDAQKDLLSTNGGQLKVVGVANITVGFAL